MKPVSMTENACGAPSCAWSASRRRRYAAIQEQGTEVLVIDDVDEMVPMLARMAAKRRTGYRALGYKIE
jgi:hypothetical protein